MFERINYNISDLVNDQLDQLPREVFESKITTFCDPAMGGGQFIIEVERRLRAAGHNKRNIAKRLFGMENSTGYLNYVNNRFNLPGKYTVSNIDLFEKAKEKYTVVMSNPPYSTKGATGATNMWYRYFKQATTATESGGYTLIISPFWHPWAYASQCPLEAISIKGESYQKYSKTDYSFIKNHQVKYLVLLNKEHSKRYFNNGSSFCCTVLHKVPVYDPTVIVQHYRNRAEETIVDFRQVKTLPVEIRKTPEKLHRKLIQFDLVKLTVSNENEKSSLDRRKILSDVKTDKLQNKIYHSHEIMRYTNVKSRDFNEWKCLISRSSTMKNAFVATNCNQTSDVRYKVFPDKKEAEQFERFLKTDFMVQVSSFYRFGKNMWFVIPDIDYSQPWTTEELYEHFDLTSSEIRLLKNA